jgi:hypothetical protein
MRWMLEAAGVSTAGLRGALRVRGLMAVWLWALRAWERDESADLSGTMAALDTALRRAETAAAWLGTHRATVGGATVGGATVGDDAASVVGPDEPFSEAPSN